MFNGLEHMIPPLMEFNGMYMAEVMNNTDPESISSGRVKLRVFPMMTGLEESVLPWAIPAFPLFAGAAADQGSYCVPTKNSKVWVFFAAGDVRSPVYFANAPGMTDGPSGREPNKTIFKSKSGITITIDDSPGSEVVRIEGATKVVLDPKCEVATGSAPLGKCITDKTLPNCFYSGVPMPGSPNLQVG